MTTIGEEIEAWKEKYNNANKAGKFVLGNLAAAEFFQAQQIWEFVKQQPKITREEAFPEL